MLLSEQLRERFALIGSQEDSPNPLVLAHFHHQVKVVPWHFLATEFDPIGEQFFGVYVGPFGSKEWSMVSMAEMESVEGLHADPQWKVTPLQQAVGQFRF